MSLESWKGWVIEQRQEYSVRLNVACPTGASGYLSWLPTIAANEGSGTSTKRYWKSDEFRGAKCSERLRKGLNDPQYLHPRFAEWVMGLPIGWTHPDSSETESVLMSLPKLL
jgi:hypothetical protein